LANDFAAARSLLKPDLEVGPMLENEKNVLIESIARGQAKAGSETAVLAWVSDQKTAKAKLAVVRGLANGVIGRLSAKPASPKVQKITTATP
jgi:hypothetical protein